MSVCALRLLLKPSQRIASQRSVRASLSPAQSALEVLAGRGKGEVAFYRDFKGVEGDLEKKEDILKGLENQDIDIDAMEIDQDVSALDIGQDVKDSNAMDIDQDVKDSKLSIEIFPQSKKQKVNHELITGHVVIAATSIGHTEKDVLEQTKLLIKEHAVPKEHQFELMHKVRCASYTNDPDKMTKLTEIRYLAIAILCNLHLI